MKFMEEWQKCQNDGYSIIDLRVADVALGITAYKGDDFEECCERAAEALRESDVDVSAHDCVMAVKCYHESHGHWDFSGEQALKYYYDHQCFLVA